MITELGNLQYEISQGLTDAKRLKLNLERLWGWRKSLRWIYQQFEDIDGRDSVTIRSVKFMTAIKATSYRDYEMVKFAVDDWLDNCQVKGYPSNQTNKLAELLTQIQAKSEQAQRLALAV